jgi:phage terminase small subunit
MTTTPTKQPRRLAHQFSPHLIAGLNPRQIMFCLALVSGNGRKGEAAIAAGYSPVHAGNRASECLANEKCLALIHHLAGQRQQAAAIRAMSIIEDIAEEGTPADAVRLKAATTMLGAGGLGPVQHSQVDVVVSGQVEMLHKRQVELDATYETLRELGAIPIDTATPVLTIEDMKDITNG